MSNKIVYIGDNCGEMTKEDVMYEISLWISETDYFNRFTESELPEIKEKIFENLLFYLTW